MPLTRAMRIRAAMPDDAPAILAIAQANNLVKWEWPKGAHGAVAVLDGNVVAFCAIREIGAGVVIDELWPTPGHDGLRGLGKLAAWVERTVAQLATERGEPFMSVGGIVIDANQTHADALMSRGYKHIANVFGKEIMASDHAREAVSA